MSIVAPTSALAMRTPSAPMACVPMQPVLPCRARSRAREGLIPTDSAAGLAHAHRQVLAGHGMAAVLRWGDKVLALAERHKVLTVTSLMLSTLGGAYSALGDISIARSLQAEVLAHYQYRVAIGLGDVGLAKRCQFFVAWSVIQRRDYDHATRILLGLG